MVGLDVARQYSTANNIIKKKKKNAKPDQFTH